MHVSVLPNAQSSQGKIPYVFAICEPTMNEPAPAQVAAIDMAYQSGGFDLNLSLIRENTFEPSSC